MYCLICKHCKIRVAAIVLCESDSTLATKWLLASPGLP